MFNYLKWELKDYLNNKKKWFMVIVIVFILLLILPFESSDAISGLVAFAYMIIMFIALIGTYLAGTKHAVNTFSKKTFLLESMIPIPGKKILLSKYLLGIIINFIYLLIAIVGFLVIIIKGIGIEGTFEALSKLIEFTDPAKLLEAIIMLICSSVSFLSIVVFSFVAAKAMNPNNKHDKLIGFVLAVIVLYFVSYFLTTFLKENEISSTYIIDLVYIAISACAFYATSHLIENKLEIYN